MTQSSSSLGALRNRSDAELNVLGWRITDPESGDRVSAAHIRNLICLGEGLAAKSRDHPRYRTFQIGPEKGWWRWSDPSGYAYIITPDDQMPPICDTASRALGHATVIVGQSRVTDEPWDAFQIRVFGPLSPAAESYVFSYMWEELGEDHPHDVARRIGDLLRWTDQDRAGELAARAPYMMRG